MTERVKLSNIDSNDSISTGVPLLIGFICAFLITSLTNLLFRHFSSRSSHDKKLYGLEHAILNLADIPPTEMWMNMGYWENESSFPSACRALLQQVLRRAGLLDVDTNGTGCIGAKTKKVNIVDLGFGCGDQTLFLTRELFLDRKSKEYRPLVDDYIGITINEVQAAYARERLLNQTKQAASNNNTRTFCADASDPASWPTELKQAIIIQSRDSSPTSSTWLLALDTLYHFRPSRERILRYAGSDLGASFMAFDLVLSDSASWLHRVVLWIICLVASTPYTNFVTRQAYVDMLVRAGYAEDCVEVYDVSEHVFAGIAGYMQRREAQLRAFGMGLGKLRGAGRVFGWWARSGVVRGVIIIARSVDEQYKEEVNQ